MRAEVRGAGVDYDVAGPPDGPTIVFSHSLGTDRSMWDAQVGALVGDHRLVLVDTLGHGCSDSPPGPYSIEVLAELTVAAADRAGADRFHVCGISMGGQVALWITARYPERVLSMTAANTAARVGTPEGWASRIEAIATHGMDAMADEIVARFVSETYREQDQDGWQRLRRMFVATDPAGYIACCQALAAADLSAETASITVPSLIVGGTADVSTPPEQVEALAAAIPGSELEIIAGAAHLSNVDTPDVFTARLRRFLSSA